ncbi:TetR/AcrR family transcriptional regulator [Fodinicola feengrottensis]|uniref:TetR/AcrR family transcriptional regulator n=1 Tax=Fodinicola feengrottensis TaxID=435914 RepID=A0ABP4S3X2_9ACTN|nr:TetR/AcrR family transcriptional regulator [Fodinicola feengrottensis]
MAEMGLRARKKQRTRLTISTAATALFEERGFEQVTLAEVARAAEVSVNTIFNYFGTKEDLFFDRQDEAIAAPAGVVLGRATGQSAWYALVHDSLRSDPLFTADELNRDWLRTIDESPALRARVREIMDRREEELASVLAAAGDGSANPAVVAALIGGAHRAIAADRQARFRANQAIRTIRTALARLTAGSYALLEPSIGTYATKAAPLDGTSASVT